MLGLLHPRLRHLPVPVEQVLGGMGAVVFSAFCAWAPVAWAVGVGTSADLMSAVLAFAGKVFCGATEIAKGEYVSCVPGPGCIPCDAPGHNNGAPLSA